MAKPDGEFDLERFLPYRLAVAASRMSRQFAERYRAEFGISIPEWRVLAHLSQADSVSVRDIHVRVDMDRPKVSRAAARLEKAGYIAKVENPADRRLVALSLTAKGHDLMRRIVPRALEFQRQLHARLGSERQSFEAGLERLLASREAAGDPEIVRPQR